MSRKGSNLEIEHKKKINMFHKQLEKKNKLNASKVRLNIELQKTTNKIKKTQIEEKIDIVNTQIAEITVDKDKRDYFKKTSKLLYDYYINPNTEHITDEYEEKPLKSGSLHDILQIISSSNKLEIYDKYMSIIHSDYEVDINKMYVPDKICECGNEMILNRSSGECLCTVCGSSYDDIIDSEKRAYKNVPPDITYFAYKRMNHLNEMLAQFQGKENANITSDTYDLIKNELKKQRHTNLNILTPLLIRKILKKLKLTQYYDHVPYIIHKINGLPILTINHETEQKIRGMFTQIQEPFVSCRSKNRQNFLSYPYTLYKIFQLLGLDEFLHCFVLLQSPERLYEHDRIWKCICDALSWETYDTIRI